MAPSEKVLQSESGRWGIQIGSVQGERQKAAAAYNVLVLYNVSSFFYSRKADSMGHSITNLSFVTLVVVKELHLLRREQVLSLSSFATQFHAT
jgi:branched-subunit amino acid transport protein AzlD